MNIHKSKLRRGSTGVLALTLLVGPGLTAAVPASADSSTCSSLAGAMQVTAECLDPTYTKPVIDGATDESVPVPHHRIRGHFEGTNIQFNIYFHAQQDKAQWQGRFFQYTYPAAFTPDQDTSRADDRAIGFALASGGYAVQAGNPSFSLGYRHTAAAAKFAESLAAQYYGRDRSISGYLYGPSGGSFQTIGAAENTSGVWQGFVPMVQAVPQPTSYNFLGRSAAELILGDKADRIRAALLPGGNGDPYSGLDAAEAAMLKEFQALGIPWKGWEWPDYLLGRSEQYPNGLGSSAPLSYDPTYADDFWNVDGYLGKEDSPLGERVRAELAKAGDTVSNRWNIANRFYYRYQIPPATDGWIGLDQFRKADGTPLYPQRPVRVPQSGAVSGNAKFNGSVKGKVIAVSNLYDTDALPWHTDWYRQRITAALGNATDNTYRVYFNDHADHQDAPVTGERAKHLVNWYGMAEQALRDVAAWAESGVTPPASTHYKITDAQVVVPDNAAARGGIQPTVDVSIQGKDATTVKAGQTVTFQAKAQVPPRAGQIVKAEWDLDGDGTYTDAPLTRTGNTITLRTTATFDRPGTYLVALRVSSERNGDPAARFALAQNLDRVKVVVTPAA
ncbi:PKD domain-containing protein (plasmid) [Arthrobacter sp. G.S.26]|uniref:PKD domain-containing protein n=1 Tax=Arthrobacter sp. G.S.26 TaxID=3433706 RepID=UPI003D77805F